MKKPRIHRIATCFSFFLLIFTNYGFSQAQIEKTRVIVTSDGEIDDECSLVRFLLYSNDMKIEGLITSSSQYHWQGHKWAGDQWAKPYLDAYAKVYPNLLKHDKNYPTPEYLNSIYVLGNVETEGEMEKVTVGSELIVKTLLDETDKRPIWLQAWGGTNTIARALKTIEESHPEKMQYVANKIRLYMIWEQDETYQSYIKPHWGKYNIETIISDQFIAYFYSWKKFLPAEEQKYLVGSWMKEHILDNLGPLCSLYKSHENGDFRSEGDSPAFLHTLRTGLRSTESPDYGGWGGRFVKVRANTWLDPVLEPGYKYPEGRWYTSTAWGRTRMKKEIENDPVLQEYMKPTMQWIIPLQNDFASRADWCIKSFEEANHPPVVILKNKLDLKAKAGQKVKLDACKSSDPDRDSLNYKWWIYKDAGTYKGLVNLQNSTKPKTSFKIPSDAKSGETIHVICEVSDSVSPQLTRYQRVIIEIQ